MLAYDCFLDKRISGTTTAAVPLEMIQLQNTTGYSVSATYKYLNGSLRVWRAHVFWMRRGTHICTLGILENLKGVFTKFFQELHGAWLNCGRFKEWGLPTLEAMNSPHFLCAASLEFISRQKDLAKSHSLLPIIGLAEVQVSSGMSTSLRGGNDIHATYPTSTSSFMQPSLTSKPGGNNAEYLEKWGSIAWKQQSSFYSSASGILEFCCLPRMRVEWSMRPFCFLSGILMQMSQVQKQAQLYL